ncbi:RNA polymerase sigma factor SigX [Carboxydothermus hydrogenoformans]|nr:RNA polymerase sigma factor SigX [Carboxydothermus hydrogenoformans]
MEHSIVETLYKEMYTKLTFRINSIVKRVDIAEELAQECFARLLREDISSINNPVGWLFKVGENLAYDYLRSAREIPLLEGAKTSGINFIDEVELVKEALATLTEEEQKLLLLREKGYKYKEIAQKLGIKESSVGQKLCRAQARFKKSYLKLSGGE